MSNAVFYFAFYRYFWQVQIEEFINVKRACERYSTYRIKAPKKAQKIAQNKMNQLNIEYMQSKYHLVSCELLKESFNKSMRLFNQVLRYPCIYNNIYNNHNYMII